MADRYVVQNSYEPVEGVDFVGTPRTGKNRIRTQFEAFFVEATVMQNSYTSNDALINTYRGR